MRRAIIALTMCATVGLTSLSSAGAANEAKDQKLADKAVLGLDDVPLGFDEFAAGEPEPSPCEGATAEADRLLLDAPHATSVFQLPDTLQLGTFGLIQSNVSVMPSTRASKQVLDAFQDEDAGAACVLAAFDLFLSAPGVTTEISVASYEPQLDGKGSKTVIKGGHEYAGFSVNVNRSQAGGETQFMEGVVVLARVGRGVAQLVAITTGVVPHDEVQDMVQIMVKRLAPAR
jgi:hypothetical protein